MKILIPFSYYHPEQCAGLFVIDDMTEEAAKQGISSLITVPTPTRNVPDGANWERNEVLHNGKVKVHRFRMFGEGTNPVIRAFRYLLCEIVQLHYLLWNDYDVAFIDSTPPIQGLKLPIVRLFRRNKRFVYNAQDLFPETLSGTGLAPKDGLLWKIGMWVSNVTFKYSDKIITISEDIKKSILARGIPSEKIEVVYNWVDENAVRPVDKEENPLFDKFGLSRRKFTIVYAGNLGNAQNIEIVIDGARELPEVQFAIFGSGGLEASIRKHITEENLVNVHLNPLQPMDKVRFVYSLGDACLVSCKESLGGSAMPSKTWSIMSCGRPVIASFDEGDLKEILENNNCGVFCHAGNLREFVTAINMLAEDRDMCNKMGNNAREYILNNLTKEVGAKKYVEILKSVLCKRN